MQNNTDTSGGTRYSEGKTPLLWAPIIALSALVDVWPQTHGMVKDLTEHGYGTIDAAVTVAGKIASQGPDIENVSILANLLAMFLVVKPGEALPEKNEGYVIAIDALHSLAEVTVYGAQKYAPHDWHRGQQASILINSMLRHTLFGVCRYGPASCCPESTLPHAAHGLWNALCWLQFRAEGRTDTDDITPLIDVTTAELATMQQAEACANEAKVQAEPSEPVPGPGTGGAYFVTSKVSDS